MAALDDSNISQQSRQEHPFADAMRAEIVCAWVPAPENRNEQLTLQVGDAVWVLEGIHNEDKDGWYGGHKDGSNTTGWFPASCCRLIEGDCEDSVCDDAERSNSAVYTKDLRAVASPQAKGRGQALQLELNETKSALEDERRQLQSLKECLKEVSEERQKEQQEWQKERQKFHRKREELESKVQMLSDDKRRMQGRVEDIQTHCSKVDSRCASLDAHCAKLESQKTSLEVAIGEEKAKVRHLEAELKSRHRREDSRGTEPAPRAESANGHREDALSRGRHGMPPEAPGHSTPTTPHTVTNLQAVPGAAGSGSLQAPARNSFVSSRVSGRPHSARNQPVGAAVQPSPRPAATTSWMPSSSGGPPPSPHLQRRIVNTRENLETVPQAPVRTLVSEFERRSNSQGPTTREQPPTNQQLVFSSSSSTSTMQQVVGASAGSTGSIRRPMMMASGPSGVNSTLRAGSHEVLSRQYHIPGRSGYQVAADPETPNASPHSRHGEDTTLSHIQFGMSPIKRQVHTGLPQRGMTTVAATLNYSPARGATISVQDRIRQLNAHRFN
jgi:peptidoglycan hydrolase CwlO-like protein